MVSYQHSRALLLFALPVEAKPFIGELGLVRSNERSLACYDSKEFRLVVTGVGPKKAAQSTKQALSIEKPIAICNVGMCGSRSKQLNLGEAIYVNRIYDDVFGAKYYQDPLVHHGFREEGLLTCDSPQRDDNKIKAYDALLVDMEAASICRVSENQVHLHQVQVLKIVSDYLDCEYLKTKFVNDLIMENIDDILQYIYKLNDTAFDLPILTGSSRDKYDNVSIKLMLTVTQQRKFKRLCLHRIASGDLTLRILDRFDVHNCMSKTDQKDVFGRLCNEFIS